MGVYDALDSLIFPRSGLHAAFNVLTVKETESGDPDINFTRAQASVTGARSFNRNTISAHLEWGDEISGVDDLSIFNAFELGGPRRLSGLFLDQLTGARYNLATLSYYYQYASLPPQIGRGLYVGTSIEAGRIDNPFMENPWDWVTSGSVYWGADTILGSAYIGYGISSLDQRTFYLVIGPSF
jgi:NTE family protein